MRPNKIHLIHTRDHDRRSMRTYCGRGGSEPWKGKWIGDRGGELEADHSPVVANCRACLKAYRERRTCVSS